MPGLLDFVSLRDMIDGGGAGRAGDAFEGGPLSGFLNELGIRPLGYRDRTRPMARPAPRQGAPAAPAAAPVDAQPMIGGLTPADILEAIQRGAPVGPRVMQPPRMPTLLELMEEERLRRDMDAGMSFDLSAFSPAPPSPVTMMYPPTLAGPEPIAPLRYSMRYHPATGYGPR